MRFPLTPVQMSYLIGSDASSASVDIPEGLTGVPCHLYVEFCAQHIDHARLSSCWAVLQGAHPMLRASFDAQGFGELLEEPYSRHVPLIDLRGYGDVRREREFHAAREALEARKARLEHGQVATLALVVLDDLDTRVLFDFNLVCADICCIQRVLRELHDLYAGRIQPSDISDLSGQEYVELMVRRAADPSDQVARYWHDAISRMSHDFPSPASGMLFYPDQERLAQRTYTSLDLVLTPWEGAALRNCAEDAGVSCEALMLSLAAGELCGRGEMEGFLVTVPLFGDRLEQRCPDCVGDFTDLAVVEVVPTAGDPLECARRLQLDLDEANEHRSCCTKAVVAELASRRLRPMMVFSPTPGDDFVGGPARPQLGHLAYYRAQTAQVALDFQVAELDGGYLVHWVVPQGLFDDEEIAECFASFGRKCRLMDL